MTYTMRAFVDALVAAFEQPYTLESMLELIRTHPVDPAEMAPYLDYRDDKYTRSLVFKNDKFEVLVLSWEVGQISRVHNHAGQQCWMAAPIGRLQVVNYKVVGGAEVTQEPECHCELERTDDFWLTAEAPGHVDPDQPIHSVGNPPEAGGRAASIHVYSYPYDHCMVYEVDRQLARNVSLSYDHEVGLPG